MTPSLLHYALSPPCRLVRLVLAEKGIGFRLEPVRFWERPADFLRLSPAGTVPVLKISEHAGALSDVRALVEYLEEAVPEPTLLGPDAETRAEVRRLTGWFVDKFEQEVSGPLLRERVLRGLMRDGSPDAAAIRAARWNIQVHLDYIGHLAMRRRWLGGDRLSVADLAAAAYLSVPDYFGDVPWDRNSQARDWYSRIKSRPSFRPLLQDRIGGYPPPAHYADLDF